MVRWKNISGYPAAVINSHQRQDARAAPFTCDYIYTPTSSSFPSSSLYLVPNARKKGKIEKKKRKENLHRETMIGKNRLPLFTLTTRQCFLYLGEMIGREKRREETEKKVFSSI